MACWPKPPEGSWTEHFGLRTEPISYEDSISPEFHELEREHLMYSMVMVSFPLE
jgi:glycine betaine catabolism A